jgi:hypothetical protein
VGLLKLRVAPAGEGKAGAVDVAVGAAPERARVDRADRVRKLMLGLAFGTLVLLVALLVTSDSAPRGGGCRRSCWRWGRSSRCRACPGCR